MSPERLQLAVDPDGTHDPIFMARRFPDALRWLFVGEAEELASAKGKLNMRIRMITKARNA